MKFKIGLFIPGLLIATACAGDWARFRGPGGLGVAENGASVPTTWSPEANLAWKMELPGPGASSPIIVGARIFVTCYSGYGLDQQSPGKIEDLVRHLVCFDLTTGKQLWQRDVKVVLPEDPYTGIGVTAHGYASHTPVSDGKNIYVFFGKSGVHAWDLDGKKLWQTSVGKESDPTRWGSSSSPILHDNTLIVTASAESQSVIGIDCATGKEIWRQEAAGLDGMWGTPALVKAGDSTDLVMVVAKELWGMDPTNGKLRWFAAATDAQHAYTSIIHNESSVYAFTGRGGGSVAVKAGGKGNVSESNTVWEGRDTAGFATPVGHNGRLFVVNRGVLTTVDEETGERVSQLRLAGARQTGGRFGSLDYPSPIVAGDRMFYLNGSGQMFVFDLADTVKQVAVNQFTTDREVFWGTPAVSNGHLIVRSSKHLYAVKDKGDKVEQDPEVLASAGPSTPPAGGGRPGGGRPGGGRPGGGQRFDPMSMFRGMDTDKDGRITAKELEGNRMAERLMTLDKDGDKAITSEEFRTGIGSLFSRGGGGSGGGRPGYPGGQDKRPKRPQRPASAE